MDLWGSHISCYSAGNWPQTLIKISRLLHTLLISGELVMSFKIRENPVIREATANRAFINANSLNIFFSPTQHWLIKIGDAD